MIPTALPARAHWHKNGGNCDDDMPGNARGKWRENLRENMRENCVINA